MLLLDRSGVLYKSLFSFSFHIPAAVQQKFSIDSEQGKHTMKNTDLSLSTEVDL